MARFELGARVEGATPKYSGSGASITARLASIGAPAVLTPLEVLEVPAPLDHSFAGPKHTDETKRIHAAECGRETHLESFSIPSALIRDANVVGFMPSNSAAPSTPKILP